MSLTSQGLRKALQMGFHWSTLPEFSQFWADLFCGDTSFGDDGFESNFGHACDEMHTYIFLANALYTLNLIWNYSALIRLGLFELVTFGCSIILLNLYDWMQKLTFGVVYGLLVDKLSCNSSTILLVRVVLQIVCLLLVN